MDQEKALTINPEGDRSVIITREFAAPRALVFRAWTLPAVLKQWITPTGWSMPKCKIDLRVGGSYRAEAQAPDGTEMGWGGTYKEVVPQERIVQTESFDDPWNAGESLMTTEFAEHNGGTVVTTTVQYESHAIRQAVLKSGMEIGLEESYRRLDALLALQRSVMEE